MKITAALSEVRSLYMDTAPWIYYVEDHPAYVTRMRAIFTRIHHGQPTVMTSVITLTELLVKPIHADVAHLQRAYHNLLFRTVHVTTVTLEARTAVHAAELRARYNLKTPDAIHLATAILSGCDAFLCNDTQLRRVSELPILILDDLES